MEVAGNVDEQQQQPQENESQTENMEVNTGEEIQEQQQQQDEANAVASTADESTQDATTEEPIADDSAADEGSNNQDTAKIETYSKGTDGEIASPIDEDSSGVAHNVDEYDPAQPSHRVVVIDNCNNTGGNNDLNEPPLHGEDEYDPANPSHDQDEYDPANPSHDRDEYDPANPSYDTRTSTVTEAEYDSMGEHNGVFHHQQHQEPEKEQQVDNLSVDQTAASPQKAALGGDNEELHPSKRQRLDNSTFVKQEDQREKTSSSTINGHHHSTTRASSTRDRKGLTDAAWDRLMDFQSGGDFEMAQVSRAAFASVGSLPEFAQFAVIAKFTRTSMKNIRDKNGLLMRIYREYQKENPHIASLQPVETFIADYKADPGLFEYGYAPPLPATGISSTPVPYQHETEADTTATTTTSLKKPRTESPAKRESPQVDEFGRIVNKTASVSTSPAKSDASDRRSSIGDRPTVRATDPRRARQQKAEESIAQTRQEGAATNEGILPAGKPIDPRRRQAQTNPIGGAGASENLSQADAYSSGGRSGHPGDPRRRGPPNATIATEPPRVEKNDLYERLPPSVRTVLDTMIHEGRLKTMINDNVLSRLLHLPEHVALQAVENFSNVDLSQIENLQGFLVGIINRVHEKAIAAEMATTPHPSYAPAAAVGYGPGGENAAVLAYPANGPPSGRQGGRADGFRDVQMPLAGGNRRPPPPLETLSLGHQKAIGALPLSVQHHLFDMAGNGVLSSVDEFGEKCYEVLGQLSEALANEVLTRFTNANLSAVRNRSGFLIGVVKRCRQEYGFN